MASASRSGMEVPVLKEDMEEGHLRSIELNGKFNIIQENVRKILSGPFRQLIAGETALKISGKPGLDAMDNIKAVHLNNALSDLSAAKKAAKASVVEAANRSQEIKDLARKAELYVLLLNGLMADLQNGPNPAAIHPPPTRLTSQQSVPSRSGAKEPVSKRRQNGAAPAVAQWKKNANDAIRSEHSSGLSQAKRKPTVQPRAPPPKPLPRPVTDEEFDGISTVLRNDGRCKLMAVNKAYDVLFDAFVNENMKKISMAELVKRGVKISGTTEMAKLKVLCSLRRITIDGNFISPLNL
ncbi:hypothetical protein BV898_13882 [Hypsibius exemplaris]|uniref:Uncharacterized protein n=1 Tax=Hypsibius exemplaris TaxID=2072580 RepID=A0A1W0W9D2_HYPEX|nr:hypothetical protein BV898_13882 [Hypsibius exemplaris]